MNKKALAATALIVTLMAVFGLILGGIIVWKSYGGTEGFNNFFSFFIPNLAGNKTKLVGDEILRYNIPQQSLEYSEDGVRWNDFPEEGLKLGDKELSSSELKEDFGIRYFYSSEIRDEKDLVLAEKGDFYSPDLKQDSHIVPRLRVVTKDVVIKSPQSGSAYVTLLLRSQVLSNDKIYGILVVDYYGVVSFKKLKDDGSFSPDTLEQKLEGIYRAISDEAIKWRDDLKTSRIEITNIGMFDAELIDDYIVVRLSDEGDRNE